MELGTQTLWPCETALCPNNQNLTNPEQSVSVSAPQAPHPYYNITRRHPTMHDSIQYWAFTYFLGVKIFWRREPNSLKTVLIPQALDKKEKKLQEERTLVQIHVFICTVFLHPIFPQSYMVWATWLEDSRQ